MLEAAQAFALDGRQRLGGALCQKCAGICCQPLVRKQHIEFGTLKFSDATDDILEAGFDINLPSAAGHCK